VLTTGGHRSLVSLTDRNDATFPMLEPYEIQAAVAFAQAYRVLGNRRERVRPLRVTSSAAEFLLRAVASSLDGVA
jgi:DNA (cytosine-5)-methyltransferase 1